MGIAGIKDIIRPEVPSNIEICKNAGIDVKMVTGDNRITARAIAKEINLINKENDSEALVLEGKEFMERIGGVICVNCQTETCDCVLNA